MQTLSTALRQAAGIGEALPPAFPELVQLGCEFRRGQMSLVGAAPGVGKSVFALTLVSRIRVPTLYFSADSDEAVVSERRIAMVTGETTEQVRQNLAANPNHYPSHLLDDHSGNLQWSFDKPISLDDIEAEVQAFGVMYGDFPHLIVVDNLDDVFSSDDDEFAGRKNVVEALCILARESRAHVMVLHHLTGAFEDGTERPGLGAFIGKVSKRAATALTMWRGQYQQDVGIAVVKNRTGPVNVCCYVPTDLARGRFG